MTLSIPSIIFWVVILAIGFSLSNSVRAQSGEDPMSGTTPAAVMQNQPSPSAATNLAGTSSNTGGAYTNQEKIPGAQPTSDFITYLKQIINFGFAVIGILALFMLIIGAYQYLMAAGSGNAEAPKKPSPRRFSVSFWDSLPGSFSTKSILIS